MHLSRLWVRVAPVAVSHTGILEQAASCVQLSPMPHSVKHGVADSLFSLVGIEALIQSRSWALNSLNVSGNEFLRPWQSSE
jgi:hypothetical protein